MPISKTPRIRSSIVVMLSIMGASLTGCAPRKGNAASTVGAAYRQHETLPRQPVDNSPPAPSARTIAADSQPTGAGESIALVDGRPIARDRLMQMLLHTHGAALLEQWAVLDAAVALAAANGLSVTEEDIQREYDRGLRRLADPLFAVTEGAIDRQEAERLLETVLAEKNMAREEFQMGIRRNAYLRAIVESRQRISEEQVRDEYARLYERRVQVRHIQLATQADVTRVQERLAAGDDFGELAARYGANPASAGRRGLLTPFSASDEDVPAALRQEAFALQPGQVSRPIRLGSWVHLLRLERVIPASEADYAEVREEVECRLRERLAEPEMQRLYERLFEGAAIQIFDPVLREAFERRYPDRRK